MLVDVFHWFDKSNKRNNTLEEFCLFMVQEYKKIIKYVSTHWLSLESAVTQCLKLYPSLKSYFLSVDKKTIRDLAHCLKSLVIQRQGVDGSKLGYQ